MDVTVLDGNDIQYLMTPNFLDLQVDSARLTIEVKVQVRSIAPDKNAGIWIGDDAGNTEFQLDFSEKWQRFTTPIGSLGSQSGTPTVSVGSGANAQWHIVKIVKEGTTYTIWLDDRLVGSSDSRQPQNLHFSGGRSWMSSYGFEAAILHFDYVRVEAEPP